MRNYDKHPVVFRVTLAERAALEELMLRKQYVNISETVRFCLRQVLEAEGLQPEMEHAR